MDTQQDMAQWVAVERESQERPRPARPALQVGQTWGTARASSPADKQGVWRAGSGPAVSTVQDGAPLPGEHMLRRAPGSPESAHTVQGGDSEGSGTEQSLVNPFSIKYVWVPMCQALC